jgi:hypothetical protein
MIKCMVWKNGESEEKKSALSVSETIQRIKSDVQNIEAGDGFNGI